MDRERTPLGLDANQRITRATMSVISSFCFAPAANWSAAPVMWARISLAPRPSEVANVARSPQLAVHVHRFADAIGECNEHVAGDLDFAIQTFALHDLLRDRVGEPRHFER